jgi:hypothetical protein
MLSIKNDVVGSYKKRAATVTGSPHSYAMYALPGATGLGDRSPGSTIEIGKRQFHYRFGVVAYLGNGRLNFGLCFFETLAPIPRQLFAGDVDAISCSLHGRICQHDPVIPVSADKRRIVISFQEPMKERARPPGVVAHRGAATRVRQMTQEVPHGLEPS